jgi:hypothetical protein
MSKNTVARRVYIAGLSLAVGFSLLSALTIGSAAPTKPASSPRPERFTDARPRALTRAEVGAPVDARCLPVTACGCTYACGIGWPEAKDSSRYQVRHSFWDNGRSPLGARIDRFCANKQCTDAFFVEIGCLGICRVRPADATCHFNGDRCEGESTPP